MNDKINIGIVEDDEIFRESLVDTINESDSFHCIFNYSNAEEAHDFLKSNELPDIILHDIDLPGMNGIESCKSIKALCPSVKILILTIFDDDENVFNAIRNGAEGYVLKDSSQDRLLGFLSDINKGGSAMSPFIASKVLKSFSDHSKKTNDYGLTEREIEILKLLTEGQSKKQIADEMHVSFHTVDTHLKNIYSKLHVHSQIELISKVFKENLI